MFFKIVTSLGLSPSFSSTYLRTAFYFMRLVLLRENDVLICGSRFADGSSIEIVCEGTNAMWVEMNQAQRADETYNVASEEAD